MMVLVFAAVSKINITTQQQVLVQLARMNVLPVGDQVNTNVLVALKAFSSHMREIHVLNGWDVGMDFEMLLKNVMTEI